MKQPQPTALPAPEELLERYAALVWKTASAYLDDPEDIKEIVNETFFEFYLHADRYDPHKGSYAAFLASIARHRAAGRRRKLDAEMRAAAALQTEPLPSEACPEDTAQPIAERVDLEEALGALDPEEFRLIRMKYYGGMSLKEIAASLELPYETVKKRHQRSLSKLKRMLILGLLLAILAALAACTYAILRHLGIVPGYGVSSQEDSFYIMETPAAAENEEVEVRIEKLFLRNSRLEAVVHFRKKDGWKDSQDLSWESVISSEVSLQAGGETISPDDSSVSYTQAAESSGSASIADSGSVSLVVPPYSTYEFPVGQNGASQEATIQYGFSVPEQANPEEFLFCVRGLSLPVSLLPAEKLPLDRFSYALTEFGGFAVDSYRENGSLRVDLYPLDSETYRLTPDFYELEITAVSADGTEFPGTQVTENLFSENAVYTFDFGEVPPGSYTLRIPSVILTAALPEDFMLPLSSGLPGTPEKDWVIPGGTLTPGKLRETHPNPELPAIPPNEGLRRLYLPLSFQPDSEEFELISLLLSPVPNEDPDAFPSGSSSVVSLMQDDGTTAYWGLSFEIPADTPPEAFSLSNSIFSGSGFPLEYRWNHEFLFSFTVDA